MAFRILAGFVLVLIAAIVFLLASAWRSPPTFPIESNFGDTEYPLLPWSEYAEHAATIEPPILLHIEPLNKGAVFFLGAEHGRPNGHKQYALIEKSWREFQPSAALIEGRLGFLSPRLMDPVERFGESGKVAALAKTAGLPLYSWELSKADETSALKETHPEEQVAVFIILRPYLGRQDRHELNAEKIVSDLINERGRREGIKGAINSVEELDRVWSRDFPDSKNWRELTFGPTLPGYMGELFERANIVRDHHMLDIVNALTTDGERVFVTAGWSHLVSINPVFPDHDIVNDPE